MRAILLIGCAALALSACGRDDAVNDANLTAANDMMIDENAATMDMDVNAAVDHNNMVMDNVTNNDAGNNVTNSY